MNLPRLAMEMLLVGVAMVIVSLGLTILGGKDPRKLPHLGSMVSGVFWTSVMAHFILELSGITKWYVRNYKPLL